MIRPIFITRVLVALTPVVKSKKNVMYEMILLF